MLIRGVTIVDTFAEAFPMWVSRFVITADSPRWAQIAAQNAAGLSISVVGCGCECGVDGPVLAEETPDGRPGQAVLLFTIGREAMQAELIKRLGQAVLTTPTTACYNGLEAAESLPIGGKLRYFGDGYQSSKRIDGRRYWRIPAADGEFLIEESFGVARGVGGGNLLILARDRSSALAAAEAAAEAVRLTPGAIAPFPGGICRSPSKVGSRYTGLRASSNLAFCASLRGKVATELPPEAQAAYEIVIDGLSEADVAAAMTASLKAACLPGVVAISAGNYGGKLGPFQFHLHALLGGESDAD